MKILCTVLIRYLPTVHYTDLDFSFQDTIWIESMNSVMDMNKTLTLASNERIPLKPHMRMLFEMRDLAHASLATVRGEYWFLNTTDNDGTTDTDLHAPLTLLYAAAHLLPTYYPPTTHLLPTYCTHPLPTHHTTTGHPCRSLVHQ